VIVIVDYGMGNLRSVQKALERIGQAAVVSDKPESVAAADRLVVPGVGAFGDAMAALKARGLVEPIRDFCARGRALLGICLGLQILFDESEETAAGAEACPGSVAERSRPLEKGLGLVRGRVVRFDPAVATRGLKVPHMGWNVVEPVGGSPLFEGIAGAARGGAAQREGAYFYFAHSYYAAPAQEQVVAGRTDYGGWFASAISAGNIHATQFHPEKSQAVGLVLLENFVTRT
jgi:imidazole glycerol-phosphate synthase subunit HisH